ncbi:MarR family transcriptional regulator [Nonomuraea sp. NPDC026600]|uniref:MarR family transcriptional regulator n=1 Tax=Nonomuraea sp. NPDC026600 TaxID=3155363 RepID=UPI0033DC5C3B
MPSASTTRLIDRLEKAGYVRRVRGERDRRMVTVELVEGGLDDYRAACESSRRHLDEIAPALRARTGATTAGHVRARRHRLPISPQRTTRGRA